MRCRKVATFTLLLTILGFYFMLSSKYKYVYYHTKENHDKPIITSLPSLRVTNELPSSLNNKSNTSIFNITTTTTMKTTKQKQEPKRSIHRKTAYPLTIDSPYLINNPDICKEEKDLTFIVIVHTAPDHTDRRLSIRQTWANKHFFRNMSLRIVFLLGRSDNPQIEFRIKNENLIYGDLVQGDFKDSYRNLTHKGVLGFRWITENCQHAKMVIKVDDDVFVNIFKVYKEVYLKYKNLSHYILCHVRKKNTSPIIRSKDHLKWKVNDDEFRGFTHYPTPYCNGYAVFIAPDLIRGMYQASFTTPFFWIDDVYLYGLLPSKIANVTYHSLVGSFNLNEITTLKCFSDSKICKYLVGNSWRSGNMVKLWLSTLAKLDKNSQSLIDHQVISDTMHINLTQALHEINKEVYKLYPTKPPQKKTPKKSVVTNKKAAKESKQKV
ncbi:beta-1,3-galactosyltransferase 2 [Octopus sinensis]|uniref:Hexosyltransferase n=1 Tax=Octopus sinensis TaxID=2607531 RepID=A0A6P7T0N1_9MOLL|nr:beta-1,3-galactosyltransferase 2 [Octopus sinensis]XP_029644265.1 beta-1,3-galactosyltransferase 2 [Octopus sinensis]XP_036364320.1 beta-1,3-galactosyltransferase 2 [Octopus sinensis]